MCQPSQGGRKMLEIPPRAAGPRWKTLFGVLIRGKRAHRPPLPETMRPRFPPWGNRRGECTRSAMGQPRPGKTPFIILGKHCIRSPQEHVQVLLLLAAPILTSGFRRALRRPRPRKCYFIGSSHYRNEQRQSNTVLPFENRTYLLKHGSSPAQPGFAVQERSTTCAVSSEQPLRHRQANTHVQRKSIADAPSLYYTLQLQLNPKN